MRQKIEAWFRKVVREEVQIARDDFHGVAQRFEADAEAIETKFTADLKTFESTFEQALEGIETKITEQLEALVTDAVERIEKKFQHAEYVLSATCDDHWKIDDEARKADEALRQPKPKRR